MKAIARTGCGTPSQSDASIRSHVAGVLAMRGNAVDPNDDSIVVDLLTQFEFEVNGEKVQRRIIGGLLGHEGGFGVGT